MKRANIIIVDEFRLVSLDIINTVLRKFLTAPRNPGYLKKPEYAHLTERNQEMYLSSAWYKHHWSFERMQAYFKSMISGRKYFVCGIPYQMAIKENLLDREQIEDEMAEADFNALEFSIEMECLFYGESEKAYYNFEELHRNRKIPRPLYSPNTYDLLRDKKFKPDLKKKDEIRILSCDIAAMAGAANDASIFTVARLIPTANGYTREYSYMESLEGGHTQAQAVRIRQMYDDFEIDYIVLDTMGVGLGVYDQLVVPLLDDERGTEYEPISCINDEKMAVRCTYSDAEKVIYSVKGSAQLNSEAAISLKDGLQRGKVRLLVPDNEGRDFLRKIKGYDKLPPEVQAEMELPYAQTTLLVNEMINLEGERNSDTGLIKLKEQRSGRKDRFSSVMYGNYIANQLERDMLRGQQEDMSDYMFFMSDF